MVPKLCRIFETQFSTSGGPPYAHCPCAELLGQSLCRQAANGVSAPHIHEGAICAWLVGADFSCVFASASLGKTASLGQDPWWPHFKSMTSPCPLPERLVATWCEDFGRGVGRDWQDSSTKEEWVNENTGHLLLLPVVQSEDLYTDTLIELSKWVPLHVIEMMIAPHRVILRFNYYMFH